MDENVFEDCIFCEIAHTGEEKLPEYNQPIIQTADFFVIPALGQFIEGYVLICPKKHFLNLGLMGPELFDRFIRIKEMVCTLLREEYGSHTVFFEHGPASHINRGGSCVEHAHLHAFPADMTKPPPWITESLEGGKIENINTVVDYARAGKPYFYLECSDGSMFLYNALLLPCQFGRKVFASKLGIPKKWDWRRFPYLEKMIETRCRLKNRIEKNHEIPPVK